MSAQIISFNCTLRNDLGEKISSTLNSDVLSHFITGQTGILSGLAKGLQNLVKGDGMHDPKKVILFPRRKLPKSLKLNESITIVSKTGIERLYRVLKFHSDFVSLDGNHPMSGKDLIFEIDILEARKATTEEITGSKKVVATKISY